MAINYPDSPVTNEVWTDPDGVAWICEIGVTGDDADPDNIRWVRRGNALTEAQPIGSFIHFAGTTAPAGYLACLGQEVTKTQYPDLWTAIAHNWGTTAGAVQPVGDNFRLPPQDVGGLGLFLRGDGDSTVVGEYQADVFKEHSHTSKGSNIAEAGTTRRTMSSVDDSSINTSITGDPTETRPRSITVLLCIKSSYSAYTGDIGDIPDNSITGSKTVGASDTFTTNDGKTVTVVNGLITMVL